MHTSARTLTITSKEELEGRRGEGRGQVAGKHAIPQGIEVIMRPLRFSEVSTRQAQTVTGIMVEVCSVQVRQSLCSPLTPELSAQDVS